MKEMSLESRVKGGLALLDSMTQDEFKNLVCFFKLLLEIDSANTRKDVQGDSNSEQVPLDNNSK